MPVFALFTGFILLGALYLLVMMPVLVLGAGVFWATQFFGIQPEHRPMFAGVIVLLPTLGILLVIGLYCIFPAYFSIAGRFTAALFRGAEFTPKDAVQIVRYYWRNMLTQIGAMPPTNKNDKSGS
jgi:hypothetical protein